ncbi:hypothetical protein BDK51DRAFT_24350 [Blyttiomyces helicus]|uniref:NodB homology domain-containing protein n=1 Tax=Blyttiomyces helicus TaxID=388810 RepID=A0A4P9VUH0_9FUNG|nr:hypothetical protein BDK51DRAFT_24350 [Blyttiomyces helicus]|eukprot:RKO82732.1 hypothetical protein BDK51DRAFT_24350 [Blyttiomyces helicus]
MRKSAVIALAVAAAVPAVNAQEGQGVVGSAAANAAYSCNPATCVPPACFCPSPNPPGGLPPQKIPQFMTLTFDDSINSVVLPIIMNITQSHHNNPNGCPLAATFFVSAQFSDYWNVQTMYGLGHEIATHTWTHLNTPPGPVEINSAIETINTFGGIPKSELKGFRHPFLLYTNGSIANVAASKLLYDSSMSLDYTSFPTWPFTLDNGVPFVCDAIDCPTQPYKNPGLWEIPLYNLRANPNNSLNAAMDPNPIPPAITANEADILTVLKYNFLNRYNSTRLPMGLYIHAGLYTLFVLNALAVPEPAI